MALPQGMRLFHFSEDPAIQHFAPRPVRTPVVRPAGQEWLNGPLVWTIDEAHQRLYLFPRDCPRILVWPRPDSAPVDTDRWLGRLQPGMQAIAFIESTWTDRVRTGHIYRYELPPGPFESLEDAGMCVSRQAVAPLARERLADLPAALRASQTELRVVDSLAPLRPVWDSTLHASGIRLRNAAGWA
jgi:hypothetical protein